MYHRNDQSEVAGESTCYLSMTNVVLELISIPNLDYTDAEIGLLGNNYREILTNKVGVNCGSGFNILFQQ